MSNLDFDVIICGGGPGGSTTALGFADTDIKVAVIEKSSFPREKVCGDGMAPYIPKALDKISPKFKKAFDQFKERTPITHVNFYSFQGESVILPFPEPWFVSSRYHFDNFLYQQASALPNVSYFLEEQVTHVSISDTGVRIETNRNQIFSGKILIGCDGATSMVRRQLTNYKIDPAYHCAAVRAYFEGVTDININTFEFHYVSEYPNGYFWVFPSENNLANVGFSLITEDITKNNINIRETLFEVIERNPTLQKRFKNAKPIGEIKGWSIPLGYGQHPISGNRFMLVGDAASVADPLSGEGIGQAIVTGRIAAFHAKECFLSNDFTAKKMSNYDKAVDEKWGTTIRKRRYWAEIIAKHKWTLNLAVKLLGSNNFISTITKKAIIKLLAT